MQFVIDHSYLIPLFPLLGAVAAGFFGAKYLKGRSHWPIWLGVGASAVMSLVLLFGMIGATGDHEGHQYSVSVRWFTWMQVGNLDVSAGAFFDPLTAVMLCVVTGIGFFITVFAAGYMKGEEGYFRFFA